MQSLSAWRARHEDPADAPPVGGASPPIVTLRDDWATLPALTGRKAAALATALLRGFPVVHGFVVTTAGASVLRAHGGAARAPASVRAALDSAWEELSDGGRRPLVVRSSSPGEDGADSSMAGQFLSVLDVVGHEAFLAAVDRVLASAVAGAEPSMAVLVQPQVHPRWGGVLFGVDPVSGRRDRLALATVEGGPHRLVSGAVDGSTATLSRRGRLLAGDGRGGTGRLPSRHRRSLARLATRAERAFGAPQDIEWAVDAQGGLLLLQSRPVTAVGVAAVTRGPVLGPGPVAETFPDALAPLESDLWLRPMRAALAETVVLIGAASRHAVAASPVLTAVGGRAAVDLGLLGIAPRRRSVLARLDPRPAALRLSAAWRTGRLRLALPGLAADIVQRADDELASVGHLRELPDLRLLAVLRGSHQALVSLHAHEILAGMLGSTPDTGGPDRGGTSAGAALHAVAQARAGGLTDTEIVARHPVVLALAPPSIGAGVTLPDVLVVPPGPEERAPADRLAVARESLRLRARWTQELTARTAAELGRRLARAGVLPDPGSVRWLTVDEVAAAVTGGRVPPDLADRRRRAAAAPLPAAFRLGPGGEVVPVDLGRGNAGQGAGGGRSVGRVVHGGAAVPGPGDILVVRTLDPGFAPLLPSLGGLVAETGSVLSHLAILAREFGVPTVVGVAGALERFPAGSVVVVDGTVGEVSVVETTRLDLGGPAT